jgi:DNA-binding response OmpR family regulator
VSPGGGGAISRRGRLLLVDPDATFRTVAVAFLGERGYDVHAFADGREALARIDELRPALVITDLAGEDLDGLELIAELRRAAVAPAVMLCTRLRAVEGWSSAHLAELGVADVVVRPVGFPALLERIESLLAPALPAVAVSSAVPVAAAAMGGEREPA